MDMMSPTECLLQMCDEHFELEDYQSGVPRWCTGCGDNAILAAVQRLCRDEGLRPEKTVFVSGIGCSSRFPHYMKTYGFHGIHGRALPVAEGVKTSKSAKDLADRHGIEMPIVTEMYRLLYEGETPRNAIHRLMTRELKPES